MNIVLNKNKKIGQVVYIVEGERKEFTLLNQIFTNILDYSFIEAKSVENVKYTYRSKSDRNSNVCVIKSMSSNISSIEDVTLYIENIYGLLISEYDIDIENAAIFYIFDRDRQSNKNKGLIKDLLSRFSHSRDDNNEFLGNGLLLLSYPSLEAYIISCFEKGSQIIYKQSNELKGYLDKKQYHQNKITEKHLLFAAKNMIMNLYELCHYKFDVNDLDNFGKMNVQILGAEEKYYRTNGMDKLLSLLSLSFFDLGIFCVE